MLSLLISLATLLTLTTSLPTLLPRQNFSPTRNDLSGACLPITIIFARGTLELGNVGSLAGPPFFNALGSMMGYADIAVQGVDYGATVVGYLEGGDPPGASTMAGLIEQAAGQCPETKIVLGGYSQGAQVAHLAVAQTSGSALSHVAAVVFFGDPDDGLSLQGISSSEEVTYCFSDDLICDGAPIVLPAHLAYSVDAVPAANFVLGELN